MVIGTKGFFRLFFVIICLFPLTSIASICPQSDLTGDCWVDIFDVKAFVDLWLDAGECEGDADCVNFNGVNGIDYIDFSVLANEWQTGLPLIINEFMASNSSDSGIHDPQNDYDDWIEIHNISNRPLDLAGMYLTDNLSNPAKWQIPSGFSSQTTIPANGFLVFWADEDTADGPLHAGFKLSGDGEEIGLFDIDGVTPVDTISFGNQTVNISYGRDPCAINNLRFFSIATPGTDNNGAYLGEIDDIQLSKTRGFYGSSFNLILACATSGATIYYTTDGRNPVIGEVNSPTSIRYTSQITISSTKCIRAAAIKTAWKPSLTATNTYIFGASAAIKAMPCISLVGDPNKTFYEPNGIMAIVGGYYNGDGVWTDTDGDGTAVYNNVIHRGITYERPVSFEIIGKTPDGNYQTDCGIRIHASDYTRPRFARGDDWVTCWIGNYKISFNLFFRDNYGDNRFDYPFFSFTPEVQSHKTICLRAGMNDRCTPFIKDEWMRRLFHDMGWAQETGTFVNLYINGSYKGYFNPAGRSDNQFYKEWYGTDDDFDIITQGGLRDGDWTAFNDLLDYIKTHDLSNTAYYNYFADRFDITEFTDYLILQIYSANFDWPNNNYTAHRERSSTGKFRYSIWDAEGIETWVIDGHGSFDVNAFTDMPWYGINGGGLNGLMDDWYYIPRFYRALKANPNFRQLFADRLHKFFRNGGALTQSRLLARWWEASAEVSAVLPYQDNWIPNSFIPVREPLFLLACEDNGLFTRAFGAPIFNVNGSPKFGGYVNTSDTFTITDPCVSGGTIYYTTDGNDPRTPYIKAATSDALVAENAFKKVLVPTSTTGPNWRGNVEPFNDSSWTSGTGGVGYEQATGYEPYIDINVNSAMYNVRSSCYIRIPFTMDACDVCNITSLSLLMRYDDGFVAYINGTEVRRVNLYLSMPAYDSHAANAREANSSTETFDITSFKNLVKAGTNILAIHGLNYSTTDNDFLITAQLEANILVSTEPNLSPGVIQYAGGFTLNKSTNLKSRILKNSGEWSPLNEAIYALPDVNQNLRITEIMFSPKDTDEPNDEDTEYIELKNIGASPINLSLARFTKGVDFTFPAITLAAGQYILVVKDINAFTTKYGAGYNIAGQYSGSLDNNGEKIRLKDANGTNILDFDYKEGWRSNTNGNGFSLTIINPADTNVNHWGNEDYWRSSAYVNGSPGWDDSGIVPNPGSIVINEVLAHSHDAASDWIELKNTTGSAINIGNWFLSDNESNLMKYCFALGTTIPAKGYIVVYENNNFGPLAPDSSKLIGFALSENGDSIYLTSALDANSNATGYHEVENFDASETGIAFGRYYKASTNSYNFVPMSSNTPGYANAYPQVGPIVITEIMYNPDWPANASYANDEYEYIELRNTSASAVTLYDFNENLPWKLTNGIDYTFPTTPVTISAGNRIVVVKNPTAFSWRYPSVSSSIIYGPYNGWLNNDGEQLELGKPGDVDTLGVRHYIRVERIDYSDGWHPNSEPGDIDLWPKNADGQGKSLIRSNTAQYGNDPNNWSAATPTPGT